jgi:hypothetical protein
MTVFSLQGASWPAIHPMTARWIPPTERSKFMSNMMGKSRNAVRVNHGLVGWFDRVSREVTQKETENDSVVSVLQ